MIRARFVVAATALAALVWLMCFWELGRTPFYSVGESRESVQVLDTVERGEWILPLRNGTELPSKPPLFHWLAALAALELGAVDELATRLPSALAAAASVAAVAWFAARRWNPAAGLYAGAILATSVGFVRLARQARVDMVLAACITAACLAFERAVATPLPPPPLMLLAFYASMGLAVLAKGPIGAVLPLAIALAHLVASRQLGRWRELRLGRGLVLACGIPLLWYLPALLAGGPAFLRKQLLRENLLRAIGTGTARVNESHPIYLYVTEFAGGFLPWTVFLIPVAVHLLQHRRRTDVVQPFVFPLIWLAVTIGLFTLFAGKRPTYILPAYPAGAILVGAWWSAASRTDAALSRGARRAVEVAVALATALAALVSAALLVTAAGVDLLEWIRPLLHRKDQQNLGLVRAALGEHWPLVLGWIGSAATAAWLLRRAGAGRWPRIFAALILLVASSAIAIQHAFIPRLAADRTYRPFALEVARLAGGSDRLFFFGRFDYGVIFYARRHIPELGRRLPDDGEPAWVLFTERQWQGLADAERARGRIAARSDGSGPEGRDVLLLVEFAPHPSASNRDPDERPVPAAAPSA